MDGIPVRTVAKGGIPVRSVAKGRGITVTEDPDGISVTIAANGLGLPVYFENTGPVVPAPQFTTQPSIAGSPQVGQTLTGTDGTGTNYTTYSRQWLRGTTAISGATGTTYVVTSDDIGFNISRRDTLTGTTAPPAVATTNAIGPITDATPERPWTLDDIPPEYRTNGGLWEAQNAVIVDTNSVSSVPDTWNVRPMVQPTTTNRPFFGDRNGFPALVWPDSTGNRRLQVDVGADFAPVWWIHVIAYNDAVRTTFISYPTIMGYGTTGNRVIGNQNANNLYAVAGNNWTSLMAKNAGPYENIVLPMPMCLGELRGPALSGRWALGGVQAGQGWQGPIWLSMALGTEPTGDILARIQGYLAWRFGLQASLPTGHPYKNAAPTTTEPPPVMQFQSTEGGFTMNYYDDPGYTLTPTGEGFTMETE